MTKEHNVTARWHHQTPRSGTGQIHSGKGIWYPYLYSYCREIEQVSIDECYMDYTPISHKYSSPEAAAVSIKDTSQKQKKLDAALSAIHKKYGEDSVKKGSALNKHLRTDK